MIVKQTTETSAEESDKRRTLPAIRLVRSSSFARSAARWLTLAIILMVVGVFLIPWQQNIRGTGRVVAYTPLERQFEIKSLIKGQLTYWERGIQENMFVETGRVLAHVEDVDPSYESRLVQKVDFSKQKVDAATQMVATFEGQMSTFTEYRQQMLDIASQQIRTAELDYESSILLQKAAEAEFIFKKSNFERERELFTNRVGQITSQFEFQKAEQEFRMAEAKFEAAKVELESTQIKLQESRLKRDATDQDTTGKIQETTTKLQKAQSDLTIAQKEQVDAETDISRYRKAKTVTAPRDGYIFKLFVNQGQPVKEGDPLLTLVPDTQARAVELYVDGNDLPLLEKGNPVRLQFEGYPAVQFTPGWPQAAMGTFGGRVEIIDSTDNGHGQFRIVVLPDPLDTPWPTERFTRQGVRVNGWVLLNRVTLGYEVWRQMNGFPPLFKEDPSMNMERSGDKIKPPLPKL
jgi:multidrug resistance efflux pump